MKYSTFLILACALIQVSFSQDVETEPVTIPEVVGGYTPVDLTAFQGDAQGQVALNFGTQFIVNQGTAAGVLPDTSAWSVSQLNSVESQVVDGTNYQFNASISNVEGESFTAIFVVYFQPTTNVLEVLSVEYFYEQQGENNVEAGGTEYEVSFDNDQDLDVDIIDDGNLENFDFAGGFTQIEPAVAAADSNIQRVQNEGAEVAFDQGLQSGVIPVGNWRINERNYVWQQVVEGGINYRFDVTIDNREQTYALMEFIVFQGSDLNTIQVVSSNIYAVYSV